MSFTCYLFSPRCLPICAPPQFLWRFLRKWRRAQRELPWLCLAPAEKNAVANAFVLITTRGTRPDHRRRKETKSGSGRVRLGRKALQKIHQAVNCKSGQKPWKNQTFHHVHQQQFKRFCPAVCVCVSKSVYYSLSEEPFEDLEATQSRDTHPHSDGEQSPTER